MTDEVLFVSRETMGAAWPLCRPFIVHAVNKCGDWTIEQVEHLLMLPTAALWIATRNDIMIATAVTEVDGDQCKIVALGGMGGPDWRCLLQPLEKYAKSMACARMRVEGRPGWQKALPDYHQPYVVLEKRLD